MSALTLGPVLGLLGLGAVHGINPAMGWLFAAALGMQERKGRAVWRALPPLALGHAAAIALALAAAVLAGELLPLGIIRWVVAALLLALGLLRLFGGHSHARLGGMRVSWRQLSVWSFLMATGHGAGLMVLPLVLGAGADGAGSGHAVPQATGAMEMGRHAVQDPAASMLGTGGGTVGAMAAGMPATGEHATHATYAAHAAGSDVASGMGAGAHAAHAHAATMLQAGGLSPEAGALLATLVHSLGYLLVTALIALIVYHRLGLRLLRTAWINLDAIWASTLVLTAILTVVL